MARLRRVSLFGSGINVRSMNTDLSHLSYSGVWKPTHLNFVSLRVAGC